MNWIYLLVILQSIMMYFAIDIGFNCLQKKDTVGAICHGLFLLALIPLAAYLFVLTGDAPHVSFNK